MGCLTGIDWGNSSALMPPVQPSCNLFRDDDRSIMKYTQKYIHEIRYKTPMPFFFLWNLSLFLFLTAAWWCLTGIDLGKNSGNNSALIGARNERYDGENNESVGDPRSDFQQLRSGDDAIAGRQKMASRDCWWTGAGGFVRNGMHRRWKRTRAHMCTAHSY